MNRFSTLHPTVAALYFLSVLLITMFAAHPLLSGLALLGGILFFLKIQPHIHPLKEFGGYLLLFLLIAVTNPLFSHNGVTPLFFLNGNPITLEAVLYGVELAVMLIAVVYWFRCFQQIMTTDKLLFLFGKASPKLSLLLSSAIRLIPLLKTQAAKIRQAQTAMGLYASESWTDRLKGTARVYSALITWALENAIDTGNSMKARGYGQKGRTTYSLYCFRAADAILLAVIGLLDAVVIAVLAAGGLDFSFYPAISAPPLTFYNLSAVAAFAVLSLLPFILEGKEELQWKYYRSKISPSVTPKQSETPSKG